MCLGQAASAAAVLLAAGTPGKRFALPHARILIHQPYTEGGGQGSDIEIQANEILRMRTEMEGILARHTGRDVEQVRKDIERDKILTADDAEGVRHRRRGHPSRKASAAPPRPVQLAHTPADRARRPSRTRAGRALRCRRNAPPPVFPILGRGAERGTVVGAARECAPTRAPVSRYAGREDDTRGTHR